MTENQDRQTNLLCCLQLKRVPIEWLHVYLFCNIIEDINNSGFQSSPESSLLLQNTVRYLPRTLVITFFVTCSVIFNSCYTVCAHWTACKMRLQSTCRTKDISEKISTSTVCVSLWLGSATYTMSCLLFHLRGFTRRRSKA